MHVIGYEHIGERAFKEEKYLKEMRTRMRCQWEEAFGLVELNTPMGHPG